MKALSIAILVTLICATGSLEAQLIRKGSKGWTISGIQGVPQISGQSQFQSFGPPVQTQPQFRTFGPPQQVYPQTQIIQPQPYQTVPIWQQPQHPLIVTQNQFDGINPYTGRPNTRNEQVENTYFDPTRNASRTNGTEQFVRRPVYDQQGRVVGYEQGYVWRNTFSGAEHKELEVVTDNGQGGVHRQDRIGF